MDTITTKVDNITTVNITFESLLQDLTVLKTYLSDVQTKVKLMEKSVLKNSREPKKTKIQKPSGFDKPTLISDELCLFMHKPSGTQIARTDVTKYITNYVCSNKLQDMVNRKKIIPNEAIKKLLKLKEEEELTYYNLHKYLSIHFI